jgi:hypothetical protein
MNQQSPECNLEVLTQLGEPLFVCRTSRKTLFGGFLVALVPFALGGALLFAMVNMLIADGLKDLFGCLLCLAAGLLFLWGGSVLWMKTQRLRNVRVVVHAGGLVLHNQWACVTCRWDQIEDFRWSVLNHFEEPTIVVGWVLVASGPRRLDHSDHTVTICRKDGVKLIFTDELRTIVRLARVIQRLCTINAVAGRSRTRGEVANSPVVLSELHGEQVVAAKTELATGCR